LLIQIGEFFNKKEKKELGNKTMGCPKCVGPLGVALDAKG
jgi:hypothetical protein